MTRTHAFVLVHNIKTEKVVLPKVNKPFESFVDISKLLTVNHALYQSFLCRLTASFGTVSDRFMSEMKDSHQ